MEEFAPVGIVKTMDRIPENAEGTGGGAHTIGHDGHVICPIEPFVNEDSKVADE